MLITIYLNVVGIIVPKIRRKIGTYGISGNAWKNTPWDNIEIKLNLVRNVFLKKYCQKY